MLQRQLVCVAGVKVARVRLSATPWTVARRPLLSVGCSRQKMGSHSLFQGIFLTHEWNLGLLHCRWILYHQGSPQRQHAQYIISFLFVQKTQLQSNGDLCLPETAGGKDFPKISLQLSGGHQDTHKLPSSHPRRLV